jgi:hypothetical protein
MNDVYWLSAEIFADVGPKSFLNFSTNVLEYDHKM